MTDEGSPGQEDSRSQRLTPEPDLDAALWPAPAAPVTEPAPGRSPAGLIAVPAAPRQPGLTAHITGPDFPATTLEVRAGTRARPAGTAPRAEIPSAPAAARPRGMQARERLRMERARQARRKRRLRAAVIAGGVVVVAAGAAVGILVQRNGHTVPPTRPTYTGHYAPVTLNADNSVTMARPGVSKPVLDVFEDFQCAQCRAFEKANGRAVERLAEQGKVKVVYHPFTIFSDQLQQASSVRAWAAAKCAPADRWVSYHNALYAAQPAAAAGRGFSISLLLRLGKQAGVASPAFSRCVRSQEYAGQNAPLSNQILNGGVTSAPVVMLNGKALTSPASPALRQQILSASP